ncbi:MAG: DUF4416 family protein [Candidatus Bipolaricaulota bacterium]
MGEPSGPNPVKLFVGLIFNPSVDVDGVLDLLASKIGEVDGESPTFSFDHTDYYSEEMGGGLKRKFFSFAALEDPGCLADRKLLTNEIEGRFAGLSRAKVPRPINLDPGYVWLSKLVLATTKNYYHRVYIGKGIYAEVTLRFQGGRFVPLPWTYPDYRSSEYRNYFNRLRDSYKDQLGNV